MTNGLLLLCFGGIMACYTQLHQIRAGENAPVFEMVAAGLLSVGCGAGGFAMIVLHLLRS